MLINYFEKTEGPVLEMGMGMISTPILHWMCLDAGRRLSSYDNDPHYEKINRNFRSNHHGVHLIENWDSAAIEKPWGLALIDHKPAERRHIDVLRLSKHADVILIHDSEPKNNRHYLYSRIYDLFEYIDVWDMAEPHTTALARKKPPWVN